MHSLTTLIVGVLAPIIGLISIVLAGPTAVLDSTSVVPAPRFPHGVLEARYDYEPGDEIKRTMCFCTSDPTLEQVDIDPFEFYNVSALHQMGYVYQFEYYNHRYVTANATMNRCSNHCPRDSTGN